MEEASIDDSDADKDYIDEEGDDSSDESSGDEKKVARAFKAAKKQPEILVYMEPPVEKADGDTDRDSGRNYP